MKFLFTEELYHFDTTCNNHVILHIFQVSAIEARPSLVTKMLEKDKSSIANPPNKITITINVDDDNDNSPKFSPSKTYFAWFIFI